MRALSSTLRHQMVAAEIAVLVMTLCLMPQGVFAQDKGPSADDDEVTKEQLAQMQQLFGAVDAKMQAVINSDEKLMAAMRAELEAIGAIKDSAGRSKAIAAYQAKYRKNYAAILKKSGVDLSAVASQLSAIFPSLQFRAQQNYTILATSLEGGTGSVAGSLPGPKTTTTNIDPSDYTNHRQLDCFGGNAGAVGFESSRIANDVLAAEFGGCTNRGTKTANVTIPSGATAVHVDVKAGLSVAGHAVALIAGACSTARASLYVLKGSTESHVARARARIHVCAPIAWAAYAEDSIDHATIGEDLIIGAEYKVRASTYTHAWAGGVVTETDAKAYVTDLRATATVTR